MKKLDFVPVILGSDVNAYGMAKSFHQQYGVKSVAVGKAQLFATNYSKIITVDVCDDFDHPDVFVPKLISVAKELKKTTAKLVLIASSDNYVELIVRNKEVLAEYYVTPFVDEDLLNCLIYKEKFYETCDKHNLDYPKTVICTKENKDQLQLPFEFPVVVKPSDSLLYANCSFAGKKKAYVLQDKKGFKEVINKIYSTSYDKNLIIQEYIPGDDTAMRVLNCYCGQDKKVKMMCLGRPLLEDYTPVLIGNYTAIINEYNEEIYSKYKDFLEQIGYIGYANIDMKYDERDGKYKVFEINLRQGRSSYFVTGSGYNLAKYLVEDYVYNGGSSELVLGRNESLWLGIPKGVLLKYLEDEELKAYVQKLIKQKKYCYTLYYNKDFNLIRYLKNSLYYQAYHKRYAQYFKNRDID
ncbi:MAG: ATP-grasp domain-containing protein [Bacillota bacterium]|nr:ATP-grasp domain-containing protein [Bacillota bacterium]